MTNNGYILIVEDSLTQAKQLKAILEQARFSVALAQNGKVAYEMILHNKAPLLVITDVIMPEMNGFELCKRIKLIPQCHDMPVIVLTTLSETEDVILGLESGADYFITKPYVPEYLLKNIKHALDNYKMRSEQVDKDHDARPLRVMLDGVVHHISATKQQIMDLLISIYDAAVQKNKQLSVTQRNLHELNQNLEKLVDERTSALRVEMEERKKLEKQFFQMQKMESLGQLTGGIAHDFNNLLMIIQGNLELLKIDLVGDEEHTQQIVQALDALKIGADLIRRLMAFSRQQPLEPDFFDLHEKIPYLVKLLKPLLGSSITIQSHVEKDAWPILVDPGQFESVMVNLAVNARDAMKGNGAFSINVVNLILNETTAANEYHLPAGDYVKISVTDNGCGIPPEILDKVFEPFFTTKEIGKGTGLGLSMVYGFVRQSHGHVTIYSEVGKGTVFNLYLPKALDRHFEQRVETAKKVITELHGTETILLVEDEDNLRKLTAKNLKSLGYKVIEAANSIEAMKIIHKDAKNIHLLMTDVIMPGEMGTELVKKVSQQYPQIKVIFISGYPGNVLSTEHQIDCNSYPILVKPFSKYDLAALLRKTLRAGDV